MTKTLTDLVAIILAADPARGPAVVVAPTIVGDAVHYSAEDFVRADLEVTILSDGCIRERWLNEEGIDTIWSFDAWSAFVSHDPNAPEGISFYDWERLTQNGQPTGL